jgi:transitional endoplasmic reticulum ATPase
LSKWVGDNEKNIAAAFREAEQDNAILLIDEVDSFLQDRRHAQRSWELSGVNEMLTQMESYQGIFIASTNLMSSLDSAALRRFDLKVSFDYLNGEQAWQLLQSYGLSLSLGNLDSQLKGRIHNLPLLTPGDFAATLRASIAFVHWLHIQP